MNPDTGRFQRLTEEQAETFEYAMRNGGKEGTGLAEAHRRHGIKQAQVFRVGEEVEIKGCSYRVKSIHSKSLVLEYR